MEPAPATYEDYTGAAIVVDDEQYITSADTLGQTVVLFRQFQIPFFVLAIGMIILAIFLIMRGSRRVIAISISLGRPRFLCACAGDIVALLLLLRFNAFTLLTAVE